MMRAIRLDLILVLIFLLLLPGLFWGLPSAINFQVDAPVPHSSLLFFADRRPDISTTYPPFHELLLLPLYGLVFLVYYIMGGISHISSVWPYGLRDISEIFSVLTVISNLVAAIMGTLMLRFAIPFVEPVRKWAWFALLFLGTNAVFIYYSRTGNLDIPYNFWLSIMLFFVWRFLTLGASLWRALVPAGVAAAFAVGSKDQAVGMAIGISFLLLCFAPTPGDKFLERVRNTLIFGSVLVATYALCAILPNPGRWWNHLRFVTGPHAPTPIPFSPFGEVQIFLHTMHHVEQTFTVPILALCLLGAWRMWSLGLIRQFWILTAPQIGYYVIVIAKTRVAYPRFMIPFMIPVFVFVTYGVSWIAEWLPQRRPFQIAWGATLSALLLLQFVVGYFPVTYVQLRDTRGQLATDLPALVSPGSPLLIARMHSENYPNANIYEKYRLMMVPGDPVRPPGRHNSNILHPLDPNVRYYLLGTGGTGLPWHKSIAVPPLSGQLIKEWRYPKWIRERIRVPCLYEYYLYRVTGPIPENWVAPPDEPPDNAG
jgi:hypothetical protein